MTTLEKLFAQIFERKDRIIEQLQQHADSYTQQLASGLLIDGITPPPWLLSPNFNSHSSDPNELKKEEIISKLLLRPPQNSTRYSTGGCSMYYQPVIPRGNERLSNEMCMENHAPNKAFNVSNEPLAPLEWHNNEIVRSLNRVPELDDNNKSPQNDTDARKSSIYAAPDMSFDCHNNNTVCSLNPVPKLDENVKSPQNEMDARISSIYAATDMSLARIQRSKSRQKAREHRTNVKTNVKSCLSNENKTHISFSGDSKSEKSDMGKCDDIGGATLMAAEGKGEKGNDRTSHSGKLTKSSGSYEKEKSSLENDHIKKGSSSDKKDLDGGTMVQPTGDSLQQSDHGVCLGSYAGKKSLTVQTQGTKSQNKPFYGRVTRSRSSSQQISGINKYSKLGKSVSCNPKEAEGVISISVGDLMHEVDISNKFSDSIEISQVVSDRIGETQAICSNEGVLKPVTSSNLDMKESSLGGSHQENAEIVVGNGPIDALAVTQPVNSGIKLDPVTSDCCMKVRPKQLNFDEIDGCDLNEICSPLSKKQKLDGLSASSIEHKSSSSFFEQQLPKENVFSSSSKAARIPSYNNIDECVNKNENPEVEEVEHNSKVSLHDDIDVTCEVNLSPKEIDNISDEEMHSGKSHLKEDLASSSKMQIKEGKGKESAAAKSSLISSLTKKRNKDSDVDLGSSKSKDFEFLSNMKLNSVEFKTWPLNQQKNVEDQPKCFSDSRKFRVHIQRDAIHCDLKALENDLNSIKESASVLSSEKIHLSQSDVIHSCDKRIHDEMICDLPEGRATVTEVDDEITETTDTLKQSEPTSVLNMIKNAADVGPTNPITNDDVAVTENDNIETNLPEWVSSYNSVQSSLIDDKTLAVSDEITPVYEGFIIDEEIGNAKLENAENEIDFDTTIIARASIMEQICKSASMQTPLSEFSSTFKQNQVQDLYGFMADGILDHMDIGSTVSLDEDSRKHLQTSESGITEIDSFFPHQQKFDYGTPFYWQSKNHYSSPVGKLWERSASSSGSSEKQLSSNPELTCFPIEEETSDEPQENINSKVEIDNSIRVSSKMKTERTEDDEVAVEIQEPHANHVSTTSMKYLDRYSSNSVSIEVSVPRTNDKFKHKPKIHHGIKVGRYDENNRNSSIATRASSRGNLSEISKNKSSMRSGIPWLSQKEAKLNNIVSNVSSFIPIVQQKQAAAVCTGKRDIKVKALEAAEAAKRREQEKENERKMKKEALKLERARIGKENAKEMELNLKKKQEELKKKEADIAARKRQREDEEKKQLAKKRKLVAEAQKNQKLKYEKSRVGKVEIEKYVKNVAIAGNKKKSENVRQNKNGDKNSFQKLDSELRTDKSLASDVLQVTSVPENRDVSNDCGEKEKATSVHENSPVKVGPVKLTSQENSYEISPYQCSDDEDDEEDDDLPTKKFVPSWASKNRVAIVLPLQQKLNPESIFSADSFCSMDEVLLPRRLQGQ